MTFHRFLWVFFVLGSMTLAKGQFQSEKDSLLIQIRKLEAGSDADLNTLVDCYNALARKYRFRKPDSLKYYAEKAIALSGKIHYTDGNILGNTRLGDYHSDIGGNEEAMALYEQAQQQIEGSSNASLKVQVLKSLAFQLFSDLNLKKAITVFYEVIDVARANGLVEEEARLRHNLGFLYSQSMLFEEANEEYGVADSLWMVVGTDDLEAITKSNMALNHVRLQNYETARQYGFASVEKLKKRQDPLWLSRCYRVISRYYLGVDSLQQALIFNQRSDSLLRQLRNDRDNLEVETQFSHIYLAQSEFDLAENHAAVAQFLAERFHDSIALADAHLVLSKVYKARGAIDASYQHANASFEIQNTIALNNSRRHLRLYRAKLNYENEQQLAQMINIRRLEKQKIITYVTVVVLLALVVIILLVRKNAREQANTNGQLKALNLAKDRVFSIIGHDLKAPIGTLQELLALYNDKSLSASEVATMVPRLKANVDHSSFTLNNLLYWAKSQMKGIDPKPFPTAVKAAATEVCELYQEAIERKALTIVCDFVPDMRLLIDPEHLNIILRNLISNAIKYNRNGGTIRFGAQKNRGSIYLYVCDTGIGLSMDKVKSLNDGGSVASTPGTQNEKGTGLGLAICKDLIALNGGSLKVESPHGEGSCFKINFDSAKIQS